MDAESFLNKICELLSKFGSFRMENSKQSEIFFALDFPEKHLSIVVFTSVVNKGGIIKFGLSKKIRFSIRRDEKTKLSLRDSYILSGWESLTRRKVGVLVELIGDIPRCAKCGGFPYPRKDRATQANPKGTYFVWYTCPDCNNNFTSSFLTGLKSRLHALLPANKKMH